eukprot:7557728-Prorocentrum_lima.AAC.1
MDVGEGHDMKADSAPYVQETRALFFLGFDKYEGMLLTRDQVREVFCRGRFPPRAGLRGLHAGFACDLLI